MHTLYPGYGAARPARMKQFRRLLARSEKRGFYKTIGSYAFVPRHLPVALMPPVADAAIARRLTGKGYLRQGLERLALLLLHRLQPSAYYKLGLFETERYARAGDFLDHRQAVNLMAFLHAKAPVHMTTDKVFFAELCARHGFPAPVDLGTLTPGQAAPSGWPDALVAAAGREGIFVKPRYGMMGQGAGLLTTSTGGHDWSIELNGERRTGQSWSEVRTRLNATGESYLFQQRIENHPTLAQFCHGALSTIRLCTVRAGDDYRPFFAFLRLPAPGALTDNPAAGGIAAPVDLTTGVLDAGVSQATSSLPKSITHYGPREHALAGTVVPHFERALALCLSVHKSLPGYFTVSHDIAITETGPIIVEANRNWAGVSQKPNDKGFGADAGFIEAAFAWAENPRLPT